MVIFWIGTVIMVGAALCFLLPQLLTSPATREFKQAAGKLKQQLRSLQQAHEDGHIDKKSFESRRDEIQKQLLSDLEQGDDQSSQRSSVSAIALTLLVPAFSIAVYLMIGDVRALDPELLAARTPAQQPQNESQAPSIEASIERLAERLRANPNNVEDWLLLGRSYMTLNQYGSALEAFQNANRLSPDDPVVMVDLAQALMFNDTSGRVPEQAKALLHRSSELQPNTDRTLFYLGVAEYQDGNYQAAIDYWTEVEKLVPAGSGIAQQLQEQIGEARRLLGQPVDSASADSSVASATPSSQPSGNFTYNLNVEVSVADELQANLSPSDTVFIFARAAQGPRMPLAIQRLTVADLPTIVTLNESMSMTPAMSLASFPQVIVGARVSKSGQATPQPGDIQGLSEVVANTHGEMIRLQIDQVL